MLLLMMMLQCTSSAPGTTPPPLPPTVDLYSLMAQEGGQRHFSSLLVLLLWSSSLTLHQLLWLLMTVSRGARSRVSSLPRSPRSLASDLQPHLHTKPMTDGLYYYWKLILTLLSILLKITAGLMDPASCAFFKHVKEKCPNFPHQIHYVRNS